MSLFYILIGRSIQEQLKFWKLEDRLSEAMEVGLSSGTEIDYSISMQLDLFAESIFRSLSNHSMPHC